MNSKNINLRVFDFAISVIELCRTLPKDDITRILVRQVVRSATSIGANLEEATGAHTRAEFINCTNISKREARETYYWLKIIYEINDRSTKNIMANILKEADEIISILTVSVRRLQENTKKLKIQSSKFKTHHSIHNSDFKLQNSKEGR